MLVGRVGVAQWPTPHDQELKDSAQPDMDATEVKTSFSSTENKHHHKVLPQIIFFL